MEFQILGGMEVLDGARPLALPAGRGRALLALLVLHAGEAVSAERLIDELWGEHAPATASTVVQGHVSRLRKVLEPGRDKREHSTILRTVATGYLLAIAPDAVDANRFKRLLDQARDATLTVRSAMLADALRLWRGPALADFTYEPFAQRAITALEELRLAALEERIEADLALGRHGELVSEVEQLIGAHPFRERLRGHLMLALYRAGRQVDALEAYRDACAALVEELGIEPGPALQELQQAILRQDPSLDLRPRAGQFADVTEVSEPTVATAHWLPRERRTVTVVFADLAASGEPGEDPEALGRFAARSFDVATNVLRRHGARVEEGIGGMLVRFFGFPLAHEDDAVRAVRAAVELRAAVEALNEDVQPVRGVRFSLRVGIETGEVVVGGAGGLLRAEACGQLVTLAARLQQAADEGEVIVGAATQRLIRGAAVVKPAEAKAVERSGGAAAAWRFSTSYPAPRRSPGSSIHRCAVGRPSSLDCERPSGERSGRALHAASRSSARPGSGSRDWPRSSWNRSARTPGSSRGGVRHTGKASPSCPCARPCWRLRARADSGRSPSSSKLRTTDRRSPIRSPGRSG